MSDLHDCVVVGGGAAGLSAALVLGRARRRTLVVDGGGQSNRVASHVGGFLGHDGTPPAELYARAREQLAAYDSVELRETTATRARREGDAFSVALAGGEEVAARAIVFAPGMDYELPAIPGVEELWGRAVFHCPFCEGWEVRDRRVAVINDGEQVEHLLALLPAWTDDVVQIAPGDVAALRAQDGDPLRIELRDGSELACDAAFVEPQLRLRAAALADGLGLERTSDGRIAVDELQRASVGGVYAAGDAAMPMQQVAVAAGSGHVAGLAAVRRLLLGE